MTTAFPSSLGSTSFPINEFASGKELAFSRWARILNGSLRMKRGVLGTSVTAGTGDVSYLGHSVRAIANSRINLEFSQSFAVGGAVLSAISTTQLAAAIAYGCNVIEIDGCVNDLPDIADSVATCKTKVRAMIVSLKVIWDTCFALGIMPVQQVPTASDTKNATGTQHAVRMIARAAERCGVPVISAPYAIMVDPADGGVNSARALDAVHPNETGAIIIGQAIGDWYNGIDLYSWKLGNGVHDVGYNGSFIWDYSGCNMIAGQANVNGSGTAIVSHLDQITTGGTVTAALATGSVAVGGWADLTRNALGEIGVSKESLSLGANGIAGDLIHGCYRYRTSSMSGSRSRGRSRIQGSAFLTSGDQPLVGGADYADPGYVLANTRRATSTGAVRLALNSIDDGSGTNTGVISMAQACVLNLSWMDRDIDAWGLNIPAA